MDVNVVILVLEAASRNIDERKLFLTGFTFAGFYE